MKLYINNKLNKILTTTLLVSVFFFSTPVLDLIPNFVLGKKIGSAEAAVDYGRESRTAEFLLANGTETTARATGVSSYTSSAGWVTTVPATASGDLVKLLGKNIHVDSAQLEVGYYATAVDITKQDITLNVENSASTGALVPAGEYSGMTASTQRTGGLTGHSFTLHDVTSFFDRQSDAEFASGVHVVAGLNVAGPTRFLTSMRIVITYSVDVEIVSHNLIKTVRLPLLSAANRGTRAATCAASATCAFTFDLTKIPDLTNKSQIESMHVEVFAQEGATTVADNFRLRMTGGSTLTQYTFTDTYTDAYTVRVLWDPLADANFNVGAVESIDVVNGTTALYALGGEVAITYSFDATSAVQTDTVKYFVSQGTALPAATLTQFSTSTINIANDNAQIQSAWYRVNPSPSVATANLSLTHRVNSSLGNSIGTLVTYTLNTANVRSANTPTIIHVLDESSARYASTTDFGGQYQFSVTAGSSPLAVAAYITFTWDATDVMAARTKTVVFGASQKGAGRNTANNIKTASTVVVLGEHSEKIQESVYLETNYLRHDVTSITGSGTHTTNVSNFVTTISEGAIVEPHKKTFLAKIPYANFFGAATTSEQAFPFSVAQYYSGADFAYEANYIVVTYTTSITLKPDPSPKQLRTVEYVLGGGSDNTARASGNTIYFGDNSIAASPPMLPVQLLGSSVRIKHAYIDLSFMMVAAATAQTTNELTLVGSIVGAAGSESNIYLHESSGSQFISTPSGITGYYHGQHDVTNLFRRQVDDTLWNAGDVQVAFGISTNQSTGNRTLTAMKLVVTYETNFNLAVHDEIKTIKVPLQSTDSLGTRSAVCGLGANCNFTYSRSIPDLANVVSAHFDVTASMDGNSNQSIYLASGGAQSANFIATETSNDSTAIRYLWQVPIANLNATTAPGQTGTLTFHNNSASALNFYGVGGELIITYRFNTGSVSQIETVSFPVGQQAAAVAAKTAIGTASPYIVNSGATARDTWLRFSSAPYASGNITLYGKLGAAAERSQVISSTVATRSGGERLYYLNLSADIASFVMPSTNVSASIAYTANSQYPAGADMFVNYVWDGSKAGTTTRSVRYSAGQHSNTNTTGAASLVKEAAVYLPSTVPKTFRSAYSRTLFQHSAGGTYGGTFALGPQIIFGLNNATSGVTTIGDTSPYNSVFIRSYTQDNLFGANLPTERSVARVENGKQAVNPIRFSNEIIVTYDEEQEIRRAAFTQDAFRIYQSEDNISPSNPWHTDLLTPLGESQALTIATRPVRKSDALRLRVGLTVGTSTLTALEQSFLLQYGAKSSSCSALDVDWQDVGAGAAWIGHDNLSLASGATLTTMKLANADIMGQYSEDGVTASNQNVVNVGQMIEYDWSIKRNTALPDTDYCFRVVEGSGKKISGYTFYPEVRTAGYTPETTDWRFYDDELNETPNNEPTWLLNSSALSVAPNNIVKVRIGLLDVANENGSNERYSLQFSQDPTFVSGTSFVPIQSDCTIYSTFCYADSPSVGDVDDSVLSTSKFGLLRGRHNEATSTSTFSPAANSHYEMEYSLKGVRLRTGSTYYFRLWDIKRGVPLNVNNTYSSPSLLSEGATLSLLVSGVPALSNIAGNQTTYSTTNTSLPFGKLILDTSSFLAHLINVKTNAMEGYNVSFVANDNLRNSTGDFIAPIAASNLSPLSWASSCTLSSPGCVGYHTTDSSLNAINDPARFAPNDTWAELATTTAAEIAYSSMPTGVSGEDVNIVYRVEPHMGTPPGEYSTNITYIVTPVY